MKKYFWMVLFVVIFSLYFATSTQPAKAYSPIIASCSNGILDPGIVIDTAFHDTTQLFEVRLDQFDLDAVAVRLDGLVENAAATVSVIKRDGPTLASATINISTTEAWHYVELNNVAMPRGVYLLNVKSTRPNDVYWKYRDGTCINDSHLVYNGETRLDKDMAFAVYAFKDDVDIDNTNNSSISDPSNVSATPDNASSSDILPGTTSKKSSNNDTTTSAPNGYPTEDEIRAMSNLDSDSSGSGLLAMLGSPLMGILFSILGFGFFILVVILIIYLATRKNKKTDTSKNAVAPNNDQDKNKKQSQ